MLEPQNSSSGSFTGYEVIRQTWITRRPDPIAGIISLALTLLLATGSALYLTDTLSAQSWMPASAEKIINEKEYWRLFTAIFAHGDGGHFAANALLFLILGFFLNGYFGFFIFPLAAFFGGALSYLIVMPTYSPQTLVVGASGVVYWMGGAWLVLYFLLSGHKTIQGRWLRTLGVGIMLFMPSQAFEAKVSYRTHFVAFVLGCAFAFLYHRQNRARFQAAEVREWVVENAVENTVDQEPAAARDENLWPEPAASDTRKT